MKEKIKLIIEEELEKVYIDDYTTITDLIPELYDLTELATERIIKLLNLHDVSGCCTDGKHRRHITEKELKIAAKEVKLQYGLIDYIIKKVRKMQVNSGNNR